MIGREKSSPPPNKGKKYPAEPLTADEARRLLRACSPRSRTGIRNAALLTVLYRGGLRIAEALDLKPKDIDVELGTIRVLHGKGNRARTVGLDPEASAVVARWIDRRASIGLTARQPVFCTLQGRPLSQAYVRMALRRLAARAGIYKRVHPHGLRHTMAVEMLREGIDIITIQRQLGHASLATTEAYLRHISAEEVIRVVRQRTWDLNSNDGRT